MKNDTWGGYLLILSGVLINELYHYQKRDTAKSMYVVRIQLGARSENRTELL